MDRSTGRKFSLIDAQIFIAVTAFGLYITFRTVVNYNLVYITGLDDFWSVLTAIRRWGLVMLPWLWLYTVATLAIHLRRPRPTLAELAARPGFVGCLAATLFVVVDLLSISPFIMLDKYNGFSIDALDNYTGLHWTGFLVAALWLPFVLSGRWAIGSEWRDRLGRILGLLWILVSLVFCLLEFISWARL